MALSNLIVKISADSKEFTIGANRVKRDADGLKQGIKTLGQAVTEGNMKLREMALAGEQNSKAYKELKTQVGSARKALTEMNRELRAAEKLQGAGSGRMQIADAITGGLATGGGIGLALAGIEAIKGAMSQAVRTSIAFDDAIRKVGATSGASAGDLNLLREAALKMGSETRYTASQAAEGLNFMAQAGWDTQQSITALPAVLNLAAASQEDLGAVSEIVTDGLTAFKMEAKDAARFADVLAKGAAASNTDVAKMGNTFQYVGPVAGALGFTIEDTAVAIGLMANAGIKGERAGTALRAMFSRLTDPTKESKMAMEALGISLTDASGAVKPLGQLMNELRVAFSQLTPAQQAQRAAQLAGTEAMSGALALVTASEDSYKKLSNEINNAGGTAQRMAEQMEGGVGGAVRQLQSAWEGFTLTLSGSNGVLMDFIKGITGIVRNLTDFVKGSDAVADAVDRATEPIIEQKMELNAMFNTLKSGNLTQAQRVELIDEINTKYGEYLPALIKEKDTISEIGILQLAANNEFKKRITLAAQEATLVAAAQKRIELEKEALQLQIDLDRAISGNFSKEQKRAVALGNQTALINGIKDKQKELNEEIGKTDAELQMAQMAADSWGQKFQEKIGASEKDMRILNGTVSQFGMRLQQSEGKAKSFLLGATSAFPTPAELAAQAKASAEAAAKAAQAAAPKASGSMVSTRREKTAADIFKEAQIEAGKTIEYYKLLGQETEGIQAAQKILESAMRKVFDTGEAGAQGLTLDLKELARQYGIWAEMTTKPVAAPMIQTGLQRIGHTAGAGLQGSVISTATGVSSSTEANRVEQIEEENAAIARQQLALQSLQDVYRSFGEAAFSAFEQVGAGQLTAAEGMRAFGKAAISSALDTARAYMVEAAAAQIKSTGFLGPLGIPIATAAIGALFGLLKGVVGKTKGIALAQGGIVSGPTMALVGDNRNARFDPEVVAPLSKLEGMLDRGTTHVTGTFRVQGSDLVLALDNANRKMSQFRV